LREPVLDRFVEEVLLDAAAARFEPVLFFADDLVPDFEPPRAEADFLAPVRALDREADFEPLFEADFDPVLDEDLVDFFAPVLDEDLALLLRAPLFADDFDALREEPEDFFAPLFLEDEAPLRAEDFVPFLAPDVERFAPPLLAGVEVVDPPEELVLFD
jgi:hypothetical protein